MDILPEIDLSENRITNNLIETLETLKTTEFKVSLIIQIKIYFKYKSKVFILIRN